jgi:hypothetical protein
LPSPKLMPIAPKPGEGTSISPNGRVLTMIAVVIIGDRICGVNVEIGLIDRRDGHRCYLYLRRQVSGN